MNSNTRKFEALNYKKTNESKLTTKQYLVYSYLVSMSKWNARDKEDHYYVYKDKFVVKDVCAQLGISPDTWRFAIRRLYELNYIDYEYEIAKDKKGVEYHKETRKNRYYIIRVFQPYAPLSIELIKSLVHVGAAIMKDNNSCIGGNIVSVYSLLYSYWYNTNESVCEININQIKNIYSTARTKEDTEAYKMMLGYFYSAGLMDFTVMTKTVAGTSYLSYNIKNVRTSLPEGSNSDNLDNADISKILEVIGTTSPHLIEIDMETK